MDVFYPFHPRLVHFPIALSLAGAAFVAVAFLGRAQEERWFWAGRLLVLLGWIGAVVAALAGLIDQSHAPDLPAVHDAINTHITVGIALIVTFGLALYWPLRDKRLRSESSHRWGYLALLLVGVGLVFLEGWLGGHLVYQLGVGVR